MARAPNANVWVCGRVSLYLWGHDYVIDKGLLINAAGLVFTEINVHVGVHAYLRVCLSVCSGEYSNM